MKEGEEMREVNNIIMVYICRLVLNIGSLKTGNFHKEGANKRFNAVERLGRELTITSLVYAVSIIYGLTNNGYSTSQSVLPYIMVQLLHS